MMIGIVGGVCFAAGVLAHWIYCDSERSKAEREQKMKERRAKGGMTDRQYHMMYNDPLADAMKQYGK